MKTSIKIAILLFSVVGAIVGVFIFAKTRVDPPKATDFGNPYAQHLDTMVKSIGNVEQVSASEQMTSATKTFWNAYALLELLQKEERLEPAMGDKSLDKMLGEYVRVLPNAAFTSLKNGDVCSGISQVGDCLKSIKNLRHSDGTSAITTDYLSTLAPLTDLYNNYRSAWALTKRSSYNGDFADVKTRIEEANSYKEKEYLRDCGSLMAALDNLPRYISNSHYYYLANWAENLYYYSNYPSWEKFEYNYSEFKKAMAEYENASDVYGYSNVRDTQTLWNLANKGYNGAYNDSYFQ